METQKDIESIIDRFKPEVANRFRRFIRNRFTHELIFNNIDELRTEYYSLIEKSTHLGLEDASRLLEEGLKPVFQEMRNQLES